MSDSLLKRSSSRKHKKDGKSSKPPELPPTPMDPETQELLDGVDDRYLMCFCLFFK